MNILKRSISIVLTVSTLLGMTAGIFSVPTVYGAVVKTELMPYSNFAEIEQNGTDLPIGLTASPNDTSAGWRKQSNTALGQTYALGARADGDDKYLELSSRSSAANFMNYASYVWQTGKTIADIAPADESYTMLVKSRMKLNQSNDGGYVEIQLSKTANVSTYRLLQLGSGGSYASPSNSESNLFARYYGDNSPTTAISTIAAEQWTNMIAKIDVPAITGTPVVTYYINGQQFGPFTKGNRSDFDTVNSVRVGLFRPGNASPADPEKSAYEAIEKKAGIDDFETYILTGGMLPFGLSENGLNGGEVVKAFQNEISVRFDTEVFKNAFTDGKIKLQRGSDAPEIIPDSQIRVLNDQKGIVLSGMTLQPGTAYKILIDSTATDVFGTPIQEESQEISFSVEEFQLNILEDFQSYDIGELPESTDDSEDGWKYTADIGSDSFSVQNDGGRKVLNFQASNGVKIGAGYGFPQPLSATGEKIAFSYKLKAVSGSAPIITFLSSDEVAEDPVELLRFQNNKVYLNGTVAGDYSENQWYDIYLELDFSTLPGIFVTFAMNGNGKVLLEENKSIVAQAENLYFVGILKQADGECHALIDDINISEPHLNWFDPEIIKAAVYSFLDTVNSTASAETLRTVFDSGLWFSFDIYKEVDAAHICNILFVSAPFSEYKVYKTAFEQAAVTAALNTGKTNLLLSGSKLDYADSLAVSPDIAAYYDSGLNSGGIVAVNDGMTNQGFRSIGEAQEKFKELVLLNYLSNNSKLGYEHVKEIIKTYADFLGLNLTEYDALTNKDSVHAVVASGSYTTKKGLETVFDDAVKTEKNKKINEKTSSLGSSSRSGGISVDSGIVPPVLKPIGKLSDNEAAYEFTDLDDAEWAAEAIITLAEQGVINGAAPNMFYPNQSVTRAEFVKMIVLALKLDVKNPTADFEDVPSDAWYYPSVTVAYKMGIIKGVSDGLFFPDNTITRQDMAVICLRAVRLKTLKETLSLEGADFADSNEIDGYAKDAVKALKNLGIINGISDDIFAPKDLVTRAQAAKVIFGIAGAV